MSKIRVGIVGASGYAGEELLRLLLQHPSVELTCITSRQYAGQPLGKAFPRYRECPLHFIAPDVASFAPLIDVAFLALPHGLAAEFAVPLLAHGVKVIDISADFRLRDTAVYAKYYKSEHPAPELLSKAVYGLPERYGSALHGAELVACPGCYPTSIILPGAALLEAGLVESTGIEAISLSGVTGAGRKVDLPYIFPECNESIRPYAVTGHRHLPEIEQELAVAAGVPALTMNFIPHLIPVNRGIHSMILFHGRSGCTTDKALAALHAAYDGKPFVRILAANELADTKHVTMTNMCEIGCVFDERSGRLLVSSAIDNLTKGASGQAIQCMNIMYGLDETAGLL
ncbi:MAG: N-acetyl-gamma-glutamyl-phosphate reductase [Lentisphaerae bacterium]|nr:N-acetyl-gamma-glutamyl-phosphate reductase [Lentisphaerota bacterium]